MAVGLSVGFRRIGWAVPQMKTMDVIVKGVAGPAKLRAVAKATHAFQCPRREADIERGLGGVEKRAAGLGLGGPDRLVVHRNSPGRTNGYRSARGDPGRQGQ